MTKHILIIFLFSFHLSFSQTDSPLVDKIKNIKELYDMNLISKKEYDSITNILVKDIVNQKSNSFPLTDNKLDSQENLVFKDDTGDNWGIMFNIGASKEKITFETANFQTEADVNYWGIGVVNRFGTTDNTKWELTFAYEEAKLKDAKESSSAAGLGLDLLFYPDPLTAPEIHLIGGLSGLHSLEEKVDGSKQFSLSAGGGIGIDVSKEATVQIKILRLITDPYENEYPKVKHESTAIKISAKLRF